MEERQIFAPAAPVRTRRSRGLGWLIGGAALVVVLTSFAYLNRGTGSAPGQRGPLSTAAPVQVALALRRDMPVVERTIGTVVANTTVQVTSRVQGVIDSAHFTEGQFVKTGDLLFQVDPRPFQAALAQARAQLAKDEALLKNAQSSEKRVRSLSAQHLVSPEELDTAVAATASATATIEADQAAVDLAQLNLDYTRIRAAVAGKTGPILVQPGNTVAANGSSPLVTITQVRPIKVSFSLPQSDLPRIQARARAGGLVAAIDQSDEGGEAFSAPVDFVSNHVDDASGTIELRATFPNEDASLVPGQLVDVTVELSKIPNATVVPREAVNTSPDGLFVYVVDGESHAVQKSVKVLFDDGKDDAIEGGVSPGDRVIVDGQLRVVPGAAVFVEQPRAVTSTAVEDVSATAAE
ncbi:MAG TPA: efflux RND transporter periplasmic adaptor subunit [Gammaproteobacteria bacterium]|nr:efflux RND transporter periplasmic adaptor subunit [Gammaproteobacteria bacterium]